jgi:hypothetical protein
MSDSSKRSLPVRTAGTAGGGFGRGAFAAAAQHRPTRESMSVGQFTLDISQSASRTWYRLPQPKAVVSCGRCGAPGEPGLVCNRADADTVTELPEGFAAEVENENWG